MSIDDARSGCTGYDYLSFECPQTTSDGITEFSYYCFNEGQYTLGGSGTGYNDWGIGECMGDEDPTALHNNICGGPNDVNGEKT